jgi:hypothetical protein
MTQQGIVWPSSTYMEELLVKRCPGEEFFLYWLHQTRYKYLAGIDSVWG